jgi:formylglycine-generating enzyme required for sulfatase activity
MEINYSICGHDVPFHYVQPGSVPFLSVSKDLRRDIHNKWLLPRGHRIYSVTRGLFVSRYVVTRGLYAAVSRDAPWVNNRYLKYYDDNPTSPADYISYNEALEFCHRVSEIVNKKIRLPSELEYEYYSSGGSSSDFYWHSGLWNEQECARGGVSNALFTASRIGVSVTSGEAIVGSKRPNQFGLHDTIGLVMEWVHGGYVVDGVYACHPDGLPDSASDIVFDDGTVRMAKGGTYQMRLQGVGRWNRCMRDSETRDPGFGFRMVFDA